MTSSQGAEDGARGTRAGDARATMLALLAARRAEGTVCPSEVARALSRRGGRDATDADWREMMPTVHDMVDRLVAEGLVKLSWKGVSLPRRAGPYRIGRGRNG